jgi:hypothetical protein
MMPKKYQVLRMQQAKEQAFSHASHQKRWPQDPNE